VRVPEGNAAIRCGDLDVAAVGNPPLTAARLTRNAIGDAVAAHPPERLREPEAAGGRIDLGAKPMAPGSG
jgi:hypothetical protein